MNKSGVSAAFEAAVGHVAMNENIPNSTANDLTNAEVEEVAEFRMHMGKESFNPSEAAGREFEFGTGKDQMAMARSLVKARDMAIDQMGAGPMKTPSDLAAWTGSNFALAQTKFVGKFTQKALDIAGSGRANLLNVAQRRFRTGR